MEFVFGDLSGSRRIDTSVVKIRRVVGRGFRAREVEVLLSEGMMYNVRISRQIATR